MRLERYHTSANSAIIRIQKAKEPEVRVGNKEGGEPRDGKPEGHPYEGTCHRLTYQHRVAVVNDCTTKLFAVVGELGVVH